MNDLQKENNNKNVESTRGYSYIAPECDIYESENDYKMLYDLPGVEKEDISIKIEKDILTVTAECKKEPVDGYKCIGEEFDFTGYSRAFNLNNVVDTSRIEADYNDGVLKLTLPKREEQKTKEIKINIS